MQELAINCLELLPAVTNSQVLAISIQNLFEQLKLLDLLEHISSLILHDLTHFSLFTTLAVNLMFLWHINFFRFLQSSFETNQTFVENREKRLPETVNDSKVLPNLGRNLFEIEYLLLFVIKVPTYDLQIILFNVLLLRFMLDLLQIHKE